MGLILLVVMQVRHNHSGDRCQEKGEDRGLKTARPTGGSLLTDPGLFNYVNNESRSLHLLAVVSHKITNSAIYL